MIRRTRQGYTVAEVMFLAFAFIAAGTGIFITGLVIKILWDFAF